MMSHSPKRPESAGCQLRIAGHLDQHWSPWFGDLVLTHEADGTTTLSGVIADQAELHGLLNKIRDLGVTLISVAVVEPHRQLSPTRAPEDPGAGRHQA
jgi:hypothetical protein